MAKLLHFYDTFLIRRHIMFHCLYLCYVSNYWCSLPKATCLLGIVKWGILILPSFLQLLVVQLWYIGSYKLYNRNNSLKRNFSISIRLLNGTIHINKGEESLILWFYLPVLKIISWSLVSSHDDQLIVSFFSFSIIMNKA